MSGKKKSWLIFLICIVVLFGGCSALAGGVEQWPPFLIWIAIVIPLKALNDHYQKFAWPMEFITWSVILLITINLLWLRYAS